ncbi:response regulator [Microbacterium album]|uniref:Response regulatory domain-containing protein n=1 Tax=Microbacterium album TaxID=2053191 RepID=A0A917IDP0_9MICO|nr:response regulator [Microbacterium album]GGH38698.1 hypothetical protein GCM10010921_09450 [Microbacterium album]
MSEGQAAATRSGRSRAVWGGRGRRSSDSTGDAESGEKAGAAEPEASDTAEPAASRLGWNVLEVFLLALAVASFGVAAYVLLDAEWLESLSSFVGLFSLCVTAFTGYLAIRIFREQKKQAARDRASQSTRLEQIDSVASRAALAAARARDNTDVILQQLNEAEEAKLHRSLSTERGRRAALAYNAARVSGARVLWVDDNPEWIQPEREALESAGVATVWVRDTALALQMLDGNSFHVVISDMGRPEGKRAGYDLLDSMRARGDDSPFIVYSSSREPEHLAEVLEHGGQGATNDPLELFELVMARLR